MLLQSYFYWLSQTKGKLNLLGFCYINNLEDNEENNKTSEKAISRLAGGSAFSRVSQICLYQPSTLNLQNILQSKIPLLFPLPLWLLLSSFHPPSPQTLLLYLRQEMDYGILKAFPKKVGKSVFGYNTVKLNVKSNIIFY